MEATNDPPSRFGWFGRLFVVVGLVVILQMISEQLGVYQPGFTDSTWFLVLSWLFVVGAAFFLADVWWRAYADGGEGGSSGDDA